MSRVTIRLLDYMFYPGGDIRGDALCHFTSAKEFRKIRIRLQCHESTRWTRSESYYDNTAKRQRTRTVSCYGDNDIILYDDTVLGEGSLPCGEHVFPIKFTLPHDLPSSYDCSYGGVSYTIRLTVDRAFKLDLEDVKTFTVFSPIRLQNVLPAFLQPINLSDEKTVCCWCCAGGHVEMQVTLESKAFVVGKSANIKVYCLNMSNSNVEAIKVELKQNLIYKTTRPSTDHKYDSELIATSRSSGVGAHGDHTYDLLLEIPSSTVAPNFTRCDLFKCEYKLKITAIIAGCHTDLDISTDAIVGHVPHTIIQQQQQQPSSEWTTFEAGNEPMQMPMPMPMPYPPTNALIPSAPQTENPSAPSYSAVNATDFGFGNVSSAVEAPPPSYDEVTKNIPPPK